MRSAVGRTRHKCANHGFHWHPPESTAGSVREIPYDRASRVEPTGKPQCRAGFPGRSVGRTPWPDTARHMEMFARRSRHRNARRAAKMCSKAGNPSAVRIPSFRSTWATPPRKRVGESAANFKSTPRKNRQKAFLYQMLPGGSFAVNRTVVGWAWKTPCFELISAHTRGAHCPVFDLCLSENP